MPDSKNLSGTTFNDDLHALIAQVYADLPGFVWYACRSFHHLPTPSEIEELRGQIILRLFEDDCRRLKTFDPEKASFKTWLTNVVEHYVGSYLKRRRTWDSLDDSLWEKLLAQPSQELNVITQEQRIAVNREVAKLSARQQQFYRLLCAGLSAPEIASRMNIQRASVHRKKQALIQQIRARIEKKGGGGGQNACQRWREEK